MSSLGGMAVAVLGAIVTMLGVVAGVYLERQRRKGEARAWRDEAHMLRGIKYRARDLVVAWEEDDAAAVVKRVRELAQELDRMGDWKAGD